MDRQMQLQCVTDIQVFSQMFESLNNRSILYHLLNEQRVEWTLVLVEAQSKRCILIQNAKMMIELLLQNSAEVVTKYRLVPNNTP